MSVPLILCHLGESVPLYLKDCLHQIRLWNPSSIEVPIYLILHPCHKKHSFFLKLEGYYSIYLIFTDSLPLTQSHQEFLDDFQKSFRGDLNFRKGYWRFVKERFYFAEELILQRNLGPCVLLEYDVLLYGQLPELVEKLLLLPLALRFVMDNQNKGHPAFTFVPSREYLSHFNTFMASSPKELEDMQTMALYAKVYPDRVRTLPVLPEEVRIQKSIRKSTSGLEESKTEYLSTDFSELRILWDSLCLGQWLGGIDSRNLNGAIVRTFENESALYSIQEMEFRWKKSIENFLWMPYLNGYPVCMIHCHSKALFCYLSDRKDVPKADYSGEIFQTLPPN